MVLSRPRGTIPLLLQGEDTTGMDDFGIKESPGYRHKNEYWGLTRCWFLVPRCLN
jgi:hypothetical protein